MKKFSMFAIAAVAAITLAAAGADETLFGVDTTITSAALDLPSFYIETAVRPVEGLDVESSIDTLGFYVAMVARPVADEQASDTPAFYTQMVTRPSIGFDAQTSFDVPVPYERHVALPASTVSLL
jgi:hypothetical protein